MSECHRQLVSRLCRSKLARMESRAVPEVTILAEGVDGRRDGVCSLNRPTRGATPYPFPPHVTPNDYRKVISRISTGTLRYCTIPCHLLCFVPTSKSSLCHPAAKMGWPRSGMRNGRRLDTPPRPSLVRVIELHGRGVPISGTALSAAFNCVSISSREPTRLFDFDVSGRTDLWILDELILDSTNSFDSLIGWNVKFWKMIK